ncbi:cytochrome c [Sphingomonas canadensis]|uniref:Cytochrome c n=1 Tax=Sphingomonas canadensis TaxID=1219257 RepID=A0ABW3HAF3_9SPHN|nr:cytochrome c [Sphingomonas canadensis]MCW3838212.1 cytochrome c [Sphingomonas canadensis]
MRTDKLILAGAAALFALGAANAGVRQTAPDAAPPPNTAALIEGRKVAMRMSGALMGSIKGAIDRGDDVKTQGFAARSLAGWAKAIPGMFAEGSFLPPSEALATVWSNPVGFKAKAESFQIAANLLAGAAAAGDKDGFASAFGQVRATCEGCHTGFKKP